MSFPARPYCSDHALLSVDSIFKQDPGAARSMSSQLVYCYGANRRAATPVRASFLHSDVLAWQMPRFPNDFCPARRLTLSEPPDLLPPQCRLTFAGIGPAVKTQMSKLTGVDSWPVRPPPALRAV